MKKLLLSFCLLLSLGTRSQSSDRAIDSVLKIIKETKDPDVALCEKAKLAVTYYTKGEQETSRKLLEETSAEAHKKQSQAGIAAVYHSKGTLSYYISEFDSALFYFSKAEEIRKKTGDVVGRMKSLGNIGSIYVMMAEYTKARTIYEEVMRMETENGYEQGTYLSINNLGNIYDRLGMPHKALHYFKKGEAYYESKNNLNGRRYACAGMINVYKTLKKDDSALYYSRKALELSIQMQDVSEISYALHSLGITFNSLKQYDSSEFYLRQSLDLARQYKDKRLELASLANIAAGKIERNQMDSASKYIEPVMALEKELQMKSDNEDLLRLYAAYYFNKKDYKKAYDQIYLYSHLKDSMYDIASTGQILEMQEKYETEKKEKENKLLQAENSAQRSTRNFLLVIIAISVLAIIAAVWGIQKIRKTNSALSTQKALVEEQQKEILDSIHYARRIQFALLASDTLLKAHLPEHFVLFKPKALVSGDFYWGTPVNDGFILVTGDCTGHGVPGAFMSLLNISKLNQVINEKGITRPDEILNELRKEIITVLNPPGLETESKDGMDAILCKLDLHAKRMDYSAANNSFYIIRNKQFLHCKADKMPVGKSHGEQSPFSLNSIALEKGDIIYTLTDGFADQFGGPLGKKFKYKQLEELLMSIHELPMQQQKSRLEMVYEEWKGNLEQVDDVSLIGIKIS